jgi:hypothetical protein
MTTHALSSSTITLIIMHRHLDHHHAPAFISMQPASCSLRHASLNIIIVTIFSTRQVADRKTFSS